MSDSSALQLDMAGSSLDPFLAMMLSGVWFRIAVFTALSGGRWCTRMSSLRHVSLLPLTNRSTKSSP
jgi:hypothetical protein